MALARPEHHPMLAQAHRLRITVDGDVPHGEKAHGCCLGPQVGSGGCDQRTGWRGGKAGGFNDTGFGPAFPTWNELSPHPIILSHGLSISRISPLAANRSLTKLARSIVIGIPRS